MYDLDIQDIQACLVSLKKQTKLPAEVCLDKEVSNESKAQTVTNKPPPNTTSTKEGRLLESIRSLSQFGRSYACTTETMVAMNELHLIGSRDQTFQFWL